MASAWLSAASRWSWISTSDPRARLSSQCGTCSQRGAPSIAAIAHLETIFDVTALGAVRQRSGIRRKGRAGIFRIEVSGLERDDFGKSLLPANPSGGRTHLTRAWLMLTSISNGRAGVLMKKSFCARRKMPDRSRPRLLSPNELFLGGTSKAHHELDWFHKITARELPKDMVRVDLRLLREAAVGGRESKRAREQESKRAREVLERRQSL
jgi:hypothetical protein